MTDRKTIFSKNYQLLGAEAMKKIAKAKIVIVGIGGVGAATTEALARTGFNKLTLIDMDIVEASNINRQRMANINTINQAKTSAMAELLLTINPEIELTLIQEKLNKENMKKLIKSDVDYIIDAIDMISAKIDLICYAKEHHINIISSMGTGNKIDPTALKYADIYQTTVDPIARVLRRELKKRTIHSLDVVYSTEKPLIKTADAPASLCFVPNACGLALASFVTDKIIK